MSESEKKTDALDALPPDAPLAKDPYKTRDLDYIVENLKEQNRRMELQRSHLENQLKQTDQLKKENADLQKEVDELTRSFARAQILEHELLEKRNIGMVVEILKRDLERLKAEAEGKKTPSPAEKT